MALVFKRKIQALGISIFFDIFLEETERLK